MGAYGMQWKCIDGNITYVKSVSRKSLSHIEVCVETTRYSKIYSARLALWDSL